MSIRSAKKKPVNEVDSTLKGTLTYSGQQRETVTNNNKPKELVRDPNGFAIW